MMEFLEQIALVGLTILMMMLIIDIERLIHQQTAKMRAVRQNQINASLELDEEVSSEDFYSKKLDYVFTVCLLLAFLAEAFLYFGTFQMNNIFSHWKEIFLNGYVVFIVIVGTKIAITNLIRIVKSVVALINKKK